jgi:hypothetical protein
VAGDEAMTIDRYDPPGLMTDFAGIPDQLDQWSAAVSGWFGEVIAYEEENSLQPGDSCQYYNQLTTSVEEPVFEQTIVWNALPATLRNRYGRKWALELADHPLPLTQRMDEQGSYFTGGQWENLYYRPQDEYCEWHVTRDAEGHIQRVTFTSEPPEYWQALNGDTLQNSQGTPTYEMTGDSDRLVELYQKYVSIEVKYEDLICPVDLIDYSDPSNPVVVYSKGSYNPYNKWNTTDGIMHLNQPANSLMAEIQLGGDATVLRARNGRTISDPDALICCAAYGGPNRTSDPTIGASVNQLAALGFRLTLRNPVGLYMHHLDMSGFTRPDGSPVEPEFFRVERGNAEQNMIERAVFEVPEAEAETLTVSDLQIGGIPITRGSQIAEHITVSLVALAAQPGYHRNTPVACIGSCCQHDDIPGWLSYTPLDAPCPPATHRAFTDPTIRPLPMAVVASRPLAQARRPLARHRAR